MQIVMSLFKLSHLFEAGPVHYLCRIRVFLEVVILEC